MESTRLSFSKTQTDIIKGVAIIFMIVLHVFGGSGWYEPYYNIPMNSNLPLLRFMHSFQICVGIYVFMIGFGYSFSKDKNLHYCIAHIKRLLSVFWTILILLALPVGYSYIKSSESFILNLFGIEEVISWVSWFVYLYIWAMIVMPLCGRLIDWKPYVMSILLIFSCYLALTIIYFTVPNFNNDTLWHSIFVCIGWTPTIILGYLSGRKNLFEKISVPNNPLVPILSLIMIGIVLYLKMIFQSIAILNFDIVYAPAIILCVLLIFSQIRNSHINNIFIELGKYSVYMWFVHALFFTPSTRHFYQPIIMISNNLWVIAIITIILSYLISIPLKKLIDF